MILEINKFVIVASSWSFYIIYLHWWCTVKHKSNVPLPLIYRAPSLTKERADPCLKSLLVVFMFCIYRILYIIYTICYIPGLTNQWRAERYPSHATFTAIPICFIYLLPDQRLCILENMCIYTCIWLRRGTTLQTGRSRVRFPMVSLEFFSDNPSGRTTALGSTQPLTEISTRCISCG